jgi:hypothetical protein
MDKQKLPIGLTMEMAMNAESFAYFSRLDETSRQQVIERAKQISTKEEMKQYVDNKFYL